MRSSQARHDGSFDSRRQESQWIGADDSITFTRLYLGSSRVLICVTSFEAESGIATSNRDAFIRQDLANDKFSARDLLFLGQTSGLNFTLYCASLVEMAGL